MKPISIRAHQIALVVLVVATASMALPAPPPLTSASQPTSVLSNQRVAASPVAIGAYIFYADWSDTTLLSNVYAANATAISDRATAAIPMASAPQYTFGFSSRVSQLVDLQNGYLLVIAGRTLTTLLVGASSVSQVGSFNESMGGTFDLIGSPSPSTTAQSYPTTFPSAQPLILSDPSWRLILGTRRSMASSVYAFQLPTLAVVWSAATTEQCTSYPLSRDGQYAYVLTSNCTTATGYAVLRRMLVHNGTMDWWWVNTYAYVTDVYPMSFLVNQGQVFTTSSYTSALFGLWADNGTTFWSTPLSSSFTTAFTPVLLQAASLCYFVCGSQVVWYNRTSKTHGISYTYNTVKAVVVTPPGDLVMSDGTSSYNATASYYYVYVALAASPSAGLLTASVTGPFTDGYVRYVSAITPGAGNTTTVLLTFTAYDSSAGGFVAAFDYATQQTTMLVVGDMNPVGSVAVTSARPLQVGVASYRSAMLQVYGAAGSAPGTVPVSQPSFILNVPTTVLGFIVSLVVNASSGVTYGVTSSYLIKVSPQGTYTSYSFGTVSSISNNAPPMIVGDYVVIFDWFSGSTTASVMVFNSVSNTLLPRATVCGLASLLPPLVVDNNRLVVLCGSGSVDAQLVTMSSASVVVDSTTFTGSAGGSAEAVGGALSKGRILALVTSSIQLRGFNLRNSPPQVLWTTAANTFDRILSAPAEWNGNVYVAAVPYYTSGVQPTPKMYSIDVDSGAVVSIATLHTNSDTNTKRLVIKSGGVFAGGILYVFGSTNVTAYNSRMSVMFDNRRMPTWPNRWNAPDASYPPAVLDGSGAICFFSGGFFNIVNGFNGAQVWNMSASPASAAILTDNISVFFSTGASVIGTDLYGRGVTSLTNFVRSGYSTQRFGLWVSPSRTSTTVVAANSYSLYSQTPSRLPRGNLTFPGAYSAPYGDGTFGQTESKGKGWIAGVVIGAIILIVVAVVVIRRQRMRAPAKTSSGGDYVLMPPAAQPQPQHYAPTSYGQQPPPPLGQNQYGQQPPPPQVPYNPPYSQQPQFHNPQMMHQPGGYCPPQNQQYGDAML